MFHFHHGNLSLPQRSRSGRLLWRHTGGEDCWEAIWQDVETEVEWDRAAEMRGDDQPWFRGWHGWSRALAVVDSGRRGVREGGRRRAGVGGGRGAKAGVGDGASEILLQPLSMEYI